MVALNKDILWERIVSPSLSGLTPSAARALLGVRFAKADIDRFNFLSKKAKRGRLTDNQRVELELLLDIGNLLTLMHSQARIALKRRQSRPRGKAA